MNLNTISLPRPTKPPPKKSEKKRVGRNREHGERRGMKG